MLAAYAEAASSDRPALIIAYTIKGKGLPLAGHKDNHAGQMNARADGDAARSTLGIAEGEEWEPWAGLGDNQRAGVAGLCRGLAGGAAAA